MKAPTASARLQRALEAIGLGIVVVSLLWWAVVYGQVVVNTGIPVQRTLACMIYTSDLCSLAMSLCREWHFLGIRRYSSEPLWVGLALCGLALAVGVPGGRRTGKQ